MVSKGPLDKYSMVSKVVERGGRERERLVQASVREQRRASMESTCKESRELEQASSEPG
jgi:hypothetical protein